MFWKCAKAPCITLFNLAKAELAAATPDGAQALMNTSPHHWSKAWIKLGSNCDSVDNNICELFNKWIIEARFLPIISMLEAIRCKVMIRIHEMINKAERWQKVICPNILKKLKTFIDESAFCHAISNGRDSFEVKHHDHRWIVDLDKKTCSCRYWQLSRLPCPHAISCIYFKTNKLDDYIASCYTVEHFKKTYAHCLQPMEGMQNWPTSKMAKPLAPKYLKMPGRPRKERREPQEKPKTTRLSKRGTIVRCRKCKQTGHNSTTCERRSSGAASVPPPQSHVPPSQSNHAPVISPNAMFAMPFSQQSGTSIRKGKEPSTSAASTSRHKKSCSGVRILYSERTGTTIQNPGMPNQRIVRTAAQGRVSTLSGGTTSLYVEANVPSSQTRATVSINVTSGTQVKAQEPAKASGKNSRQLPHLLFSPKRPHVFSNTQ